jgi:hypothetical protein
MSTQTLFAVPTVDVRTLECDAVVVTARSESEAVGLVLRNAAQLRYTGGEIVRCEVPAEDAIVRDIWSDRWRACKL